MQASESIRDAILSAQDPWPALKLERSVARPQVNQVIGGLYLGNDEKFVEITSIECRSAKNIPIDTSNPHLFECAVSVCTYVRMVREMPDLEKYPLQYVEETLKAKNIEWIQMGRAIPDDKQAWTDLVYNASLENPPLAQEDLLIPDESQDPAHLALRAAKREIVEGLPVDKWFESAFKIFDTAVNGKKTLVHCHAGASRSPTLVAAYLINRYKVDAEQSIIFLRTKRNCANPKCVKELKDYAQALNPTL